MTGSERPTLKNLYLHVTPNYAAFWYDIGVYLDFEQGRLDTIKANHPGDTSGCCKELWREWLKTTPNATWKNLFDVISYLDNSTSSSSVSIGMLVSSP